MTLISFKKAVCNLVLVSLIFTQVLVPEAYALDVKPAKATTKSDVVYDLITVVVDTSVDNDGTDYKGLIDKFPKKLSADTLSERVLRYAQDLRDSNSMTDVRILFFDKTKETVNDLAIALENLYVNGDGTHKNYLSGVVLVGDIPLPVVNKDGQKIVSVFPYVDFVDKAYLYNPITNTYEANQMVNLAMPEVWHGLITAKSALDMAFFFDKNHLYYEGEDEYAKFDKRLFYSNLVEERARLNDDVYKSYLRYLKSAESLSYTRYNKYWAAALMALANNESGVNSFDPQNVSQEIPDLQFKTAIDQLLLPYYKVVSRYLSDLNDTVDNTGRYTPSDVDSIPSLITVKDEYNKQYLRTVNDALENSVNKVVAKIQEPVDLLKSSSLKVNVAGTSQQVVQYHSQKNGYYVNGIRGENVDSAKLCSLYLGSSLPVKASRAGSKLPSLNLYSIGVNTRLLSPAEAHKLTSGSVSSGAVIEEMPEYGVPAFYDNPLAKNYKNPLDGLLKAGDVIFKIDNKLINSSYTLDSAVITAFSNAVSSGEGNMKIEFYHGDKKLIETANFKLDKGKPKSGVLFEVSSAEKLGIAPLLDPASSVAVKLDHPIDEVHYNSCYSSSIKSAADVVLSTAPLITLKDYADRYGLFDAVDNDGDGVIHGDLDEASIKYGLTDMDEISRKMLSKPGTYTIPSTVAGGFGSDVTLTVTTSSYKKISSAISHNEPTDYTLSKQTQLGMTKSLPIDDPRYSAFQNSDGEIEQIVYPNLFKLDNYAQLVVQLDQIAWKIAQTPGKHKLFGKNAQAASYSTFEGQQKVHDEVLNKYLSPAIASAIDASPDGFNLDAASAEKIYDAFDWKSFDLNEKHQYVLSNYLSGVKNAFVGDKTLLPAPFGFDEQYGYEAAYMVVDGDQDSFDLDFNINLKEELDATFDPFVDDADEVEEEAALEAEENLEIISAPFTGDLQNTGATQVVSGDVSTPKSLSSSELPSVPLPQFMGEITKFLKSISSKVKLKQACEFGAENKKSLGGSFKPVYPKSNTAGTTTNNNAVGNSSGTSPLGSAAESGSTANSSPIADDTLLDPVSIEVTPESYTLVANNESKTKLKVVIKNKNGEVINNSFFKVTLFTDDSVYIDETADTYPSVAGTQLSTFDGEAEVDLFARGKTGKSEIRVVLNDLEFEEALAQVNNKISKLDYSKHLSATTKLQIIDDAKLKFVLDKSSIKADGKSMASVKTELIYNGNPIKYNGPISYKLLTPNLGHFAFSPPSNMVNGALHNANVKFVSSNSSGVAEILVNVPGFASDTVRIFVGASDPSEISITYEKTKDTIQLIASILDKNGNLVTGDNKTLVTFTPTDATKELVGFASAKSAVALNGKATVEVEAKNLSGIVNVVAEANGLKKGKISFEVNKEITNKMVKGINPRALYVSLLGDGAGAVLGDQNVAESFVFSGGQVQAVSAQFSEPFSQKPIVGIDGYGKISMLSDLLTARTVTSTDEFPYQKVVYADDVLGKELFSMFVIPNTDSDFAIVPGDVPDSNGVYVSQLGDGFEYLKKGDKIDILSDGIVVANVDKFGRVTIFDESVELKVATEEEGVSVNSFALLLASSGINQTLITFKQKFKDINGQNRDAFVIPYGKKLKSFNPGVYIQMNTALERYSVIDAFTGSSTAEPRGVYFVDNEIIDQSPSLSAKGFIGDDKHMMLFSAGNNVGESNRVYATDSNVVYGDPNVKVKMAGVVGLISQSTGFGKTLGQQIYRGSKEISSISSFDYDNDGVDDVLVAYEDGYFRLLENNGGKFKDRGYILKVFGGVKSFVVLDMNNDGFDDLIVDGERRYQIINNNGHFERSLLPLALSGEIFDMEVGDMDVDGCSDLVVSDDSGNVRIFLNEPNGKLCSGISSNHVYSTNLGEKVYVDIVDDFKKFKDEYPDVRIRFDGGSDGSLTHIYSTSKNEYDIHKQVPVSTQSEADKYYEEQLEKSGLPSAKDLEDPEKAGEILKNLVGKSSVDSDYDGCADGLDKTDNSFADLATSVANQVATTIYKLRCSEGGCFPTPDNKAYFAPDGSPGTAAIAFIENYPFALFGVPSNTKSYARLYISPTKTLGLGTAICYGKYPDAQCFAAAVPPSLIGGCSKFLGPVDDVLSKSKNVNSKSKNGNSTIISNGKASTGSDVIGINGPNRNINARIPGFPSGVTDWLDKQTDEIYNKLLDLPDIYFIYPDYKSFGTLLTPTSDRPNGLRDVLRYINSIPLVQIEGREVLIKVPAVSRSEFVKWGRQKDAWVKHMNVQIKRLEDLDYFRCKEDKTRKVLCDKLRVKMEGLVSDVVKLSNQVDQIANFPTEILKWKNAEAKYATQLACYVDAIINFVTGYIKRQTSILAAWVKAGEDVVRTFKGWKAILDLSADYQKSCDNCKTDRFSKISSLIDLFASAPDLPVVPMPKWPDIIFDISQIKTGAKIIWPDLIFKPEPIVLPNLPLITLPDDPFPDLVFDISKLDLPDLPTFPFEGLTLPELPDLPALPFPELPDLPKPPKIPKLPKAMKKVAIDLKPVLKVACLIKKGQLLVPESKLATQIEILTQPSVQATIPFVKHLATASEAIEYDYLDQVRVEVKTSFGVDSNAVYAPVKALSDELNDVSKDIADEINEVTNLPWQHVIDNFINNSVKKVTEPKKESSIPLAYESLRETLNEVIADAGDEAVPSELRVTSGSRLLSKDDPILNRSLDQLEHEMVRTVDSNNESVTRLVELRNSLMAYAKGIDKFETIEDVYGYERAIADNGGGVKRLAALSGFELDSDNVKQESFSIFGEDMQERIESAAALGSRLVAEETTAPLPADDSIVPKGFYVAVNGKSESVLNYLDEIDNAVTIFTDVDDDGDEDIIYTMGNGVYVKTNYSKMPKEKKGKLVAKSDESSVSDFAGFVSSVQNVSSDSEAHKKAELGWIGALNYAGNYEIDLRNSLDAKPFKTIVTDEASTTIEIENGDYYVTVYTLNANGERSLASFSTVLSPQKYADNDAPLPAIVDTNLDVSLFETVEIDASGSKDLSGEIVKYYLEVLPYSNGDKKVTKLPREIWSDLSPLVDEDEDGVKWNEKNNPMFRVGPFINEGDIGVHEMILHVVDQAGNSSKMALSLNVFAPTITLSMDGSTELIASGEISSKSAIGVTLMRKRYGYRVIDSILSLVPDIKNVSPTTTDSAGKYEVSGFNLDNMILVKNSAGDVLAEINPATGNIGALKLGHKVLVRGAIPDKSPTYLEIINSKNTSLAKVYLVADSNSDVKVHTVKDEQMGSVNIYDNNLDDKYVATPLASDFYPYPGGVIIGDDKKPLAILDTSGNIVVIDNSVSLSKASNNHELDDVVINLTVGGKVAFEILIKINGNSIILGPNDIPVNNPGEVPEAPAFKGLPFADYADLDENMVASIKDLYDKNIIEGVHTENGLYINPNDLASRSEFVKIILKMVCIKPGADASKAFNPALFSDIEFSESNPSWFYPFIKEAHSRGLINGYQGEKDPVTGLVPFKPDSNITRAEAVKIILETLEMQGVINLDSIQASDVWYEPYIKIAQNLTPVLNDNVALKSNFIISPEQASLPDELVTRGDLISMVSKVLEIYNCFVEEDQVLRTAPEPKAPENYKEPIGGVYVVPADCSTCPCDTTISYEADVVSGDIFFSVISNLSANHIFSKSNEVKIE